MIEEIRKRIKAASDNTDEAGPYDEFESGQGVGLATALQIIDEVVKEYPVPADVQEAADKYIGHPYELDEGVEVSMRRNSYAAGMLAERERLMREPRRGFAGVARQWIEARFGKTRAPEKVIGYCIDMPTLQEFARYVANCEDERLMKNAVYGEIVKDISGELGVSAKAIPDGFKFGEKVKVIIIKEAKK